MEQEIKKDKGVQRDYHGPQRFHVGDSETRNHGL